MWLKLETKHEAMLHGPRCPPCWRGFAIRAFLIITLYSIPVVRGILEVNLSEKAICSL